jgi:hypothetical protein
LLDLCFDIEKVLLILLDSKRVRKEQYLWIGDLLFHSVVSDALLDDYTIDIFAFARVFVLNKLNLHVFGDVNAVTTFV